MTTDELQAPGSEEELCIAAIAEDVEPRRPVMTGDVFDDVSIPGLDDGTGLAIVLTHPCSMRQSDNLVERLLIEKQCRYRA